MRKRDRPNRWSGRGDLATLERRWVSLPTLGHTLTIPDHTLKPVWLQFETGLDPRRSPTAPCHPYASPRAARVHKATLRAFGLAAYAVASRTSAALPGP